MVTVRRIGLTLALLALGAAAVSAQLRPVDEIEVRVLPQAEVFGDEFALGEIAEMDGFNLEALAQLAKVSMGTSPLPGRSLRLSESALRSRLAPATKSLNVRLIVPDDAHVVRAAQVIAGAELERMVLERAHADTPQQAGDELRQEMAGPISDVVLPKGEVAWNLEMLGNHLVPGGSRLYQLIAVMNGDQAWKGTARVRQSIYRDVIVAGRPIRRHQRISRGDLTTERRDISLQRGEPYLSSFEQVVGRLAKRPIGRHQTLHDALLAKPADVAEGGRVVLMYESKMLVLKVPGVAMVQGRAGQFIPVKNLQSGKIVHGILQPDETVKVN